MIIYKLIVFLPIIGAIIAGLGGGQIGAIVLTLRHRGYVKRQDINVQNARTKTMAMDVKKVPAGQGLQDSDSGNWIK